MEQLADLSFEPVVPVPRQAVNGEATREVEIKLSLARELHDNVVQALTVMVVEMEHFKLRQAGRETEVGEVNRLQQLAREALSNLRETVHELRGVARVDGDVVQRVREALDRLERETGIRATLSVASSWPEVLPLAVGRNLYRVIEEALNNARAHSGASQVTVSMCSADGSAVVAVQDNGRGFGPLSAPADRSLDGFGVLGMNERALLIGGTLHIDTAKGQGTKVSLTFPLPTSK